jgi:hypothetical protein
MPRPPRFEFSEAIYYVINRGCINRDRLIIIVTYTFPGLIVLGGVMRQARIKLEGKSSVYHCMTKIVGGDFFLEGGERRRYFVSRFGRCLHFAVSRC